jgi:hypothetical protein
MRSFLATGLRLAGLILALGLMAGTAAEARSVPPGSYLRSCRDAQVRDGADLAAFCATRNGQWVVTRLNDFPSCRGDISNQDGQLWCQRRPVPPPPAVGPRGSYRQTCTRVEFRNGVLSAFCLTRGGNYQPSVLNTLTCQPGSDISNQNGQLFCPSRQRLQPQHLHGPRRRAARPVPAGERLVEPDRAQHEQLRQLPRHLQPERQPRLLLTFVYR